jgi:hypothetical protein
LLNGPMAFPLNFRDLKNILQLSDVSESCRSSYRIKVSTIGASSITYWPFLLQQFMNVC